MVVNAQAAVTWVKGGFHAIGWLVGLLSLHTGRMWSLQYDRIRPHDMGTCRTEIMLFRNFIGKATLYSAVCGACSFLHSFPEFETWTWSRPCENLLVKLLWSPGNHCIRSASGQGRNWFSSTGNWTNKTSCVVCSGVIERFVFLHSFQEVKA